jgi:hypothetical protein
MPPSEPKPASKKYFLCTGELVNAEKIHKFPSAHIVGELRLTTDRESGRTVSELAVFRQSLPTTDVPLIRPAVAAYVSHSRKVCCSLCDRGPRWVINQSAFMALMRHFGVTSLEEGVK